MADLEAAKKRLFEHLSRSVRDSRVIDAMASVPRELFIPDDLQYAAYDDRPLGIGYGQTISQPYIIALMTSSFDLTGTDKVLEIGTGSGYQSAILSRLAAKVISIERIAQLAENARKTLANLGCHNVEINTAGRELGWPNEAPYDAVLVTAAAPAVPQTLLNQLKHHGRLVIPVGSKWEQDLLKIVRFENSSTTESLGACRFVPLIGKDAWDK